jgi:endonuclease VIII
MPEGHTIHRLARDHATALSGQRVTITSPQGRFTEAKKVSGSEVVSTDAWGKHLFWWFDSSAGIHIHLGLFGKFRVHRTSEPPPPGPNVRMRAQATDVTIDLSGPTACEVIDEAGFDERVARLGLDPLRTAKLTDDVVSKLRRRSAAIGGVLLDQSVIAGIGNVYRAEVLFICGIDPRRAANSLSPAEIDHLWSVTRTQLQRGVRANRIVTVDPHEIGRKGRLRAGERLYVYKQEHCRRCATEIDAVELGNRPCYFCPTCQH